MIHSVLGTTALFYSFELELAIGLSCVVSYGHVAVSYYYLVIALMSVAKRVEQSCSVVRRM